MLEINVTIHCPELLALAEALGAKTTTTTTTTPVEATPAPVAPVAAAPAYTLEQIAQAGAGLLRDNPGLMPQMTGLLQQFGLQAVSELKPDQIPAFADALKALGAKL